MQVGGDSSTNVDVEHRCGVATAVGGDVGDRDAGVTQAGDESIRLSNRDEFSRRVPDEEGWIAGIHVVERRRIPCLGAIGVARAPEVVELRLAKSFAHPAERKAGGGEIDRPTEADDGGHPGAGGEIALAFEAQLRNQVAARRPAEGADPVGGEGEALHLSVIAQPPHHLSYVVDPRGIRMFRCQPVIDRYRHEPLRREPLADGPPGRDGLVALTPTPPVHREHGGPRRERHRVTGADRGIWLLVGEAHVDPHRGVFRPEGHVFENFDSGVLAGERVRRDVVGCRRHRLAADGRACGEQPDADHHGGKRAGDFRHGGPNFRCGRLGL